MSSFGVHLKRSQAADLILQSPQRLPTLEVFPKLATALHIHEETFPANFPRALSSHCEKLLPQKLDSGLDLKRLQA